jgi:hypothetical protein
MITENDKAAALHALILEQRIKNLVGQISELLTPICTRLMEENNRKDIEAMIAMLPSGFERSELQTFLRMNHY